MSRQVPQRFHKAEFLQFKAPNQIKSYLLNSGSHEAGLVTPKVHSYTNYKT